MVNKLVGLIGWPVEHSLSPLMHNASFKELGLNQWNYVLLPVEKNPSCRIKEAILGLRALGFQGANVTVPYKEAVVPFLDELSDTAKVIGAVNTIVIDSAGRLIGHTTDGDGFIRDIHEHAVQIKGKDIVLIGAGGAARSIAFALLQHGCARLTIINRTKANADALANDFAHLFPAIPINTSIVHNDIDQQLRGADIVINSTSIGMVPNVDAMPLKKVSFSKHQVVYDIIYNPKKTALLKKAEHDGAHAINGVGMLVHQGALAFKLWTGFDAPVHLMKKIAKEN